jgi:hypothetical protein
MKQHCNFSVEEDFELHKAGARAVSYGTVILVWTKTVGYTRVSSGIAANVALQI